jgi:hypothetical protein
MEDTDPFREDFDNLVRLFKKLPTPRRAEAKKLLEFTVSDTRSLTTNIFTPAPDVNANEALSFTDPITETIECGILVAKPDPPVSSRAANANLSLELPLNPPPPKDTINPSSSNTMQSGKRKCDYTDDEKRAAVKLLAETKNALLTSKRLNTTTGKKYDEKSLREWKTEFKNFFNECCEEFKHHKRQRDNYHPNKSMEIDLLEWLKGQRQQNLIVKRIDLQKKALQLSSDPEFKASDGWFDRFQDRWKVRRRTPTHEMQKIKDNAWIQVVDYLEKIRTYRVECETKKGSECIFVNMDEVPLQFDDLGRTYDFLGAKEVKVLSTASKKQRFTMGLAITSEGKILPPLFIFKRKTDLSVVFREKWDGLALIAANRTAWMNTDLMKTWIQKILLNFDLSLNQILCLVFDKFSAHEAAEVNALLKEAGVKCFIIPGGCTGMLQPLDTCINKPLKDRIRAKILDYIDVNSKKPTLEKVPFPSLDLVITWVIKSLDTLEQDLLIKSFKHCGK